MTDEQTLHVLNKIDRLIETAVLTVWAYHDAKANEFLFLPEADYGSAAFTTGREDALKRGAVAIGAVALMAHTGENGTALIEDEMFPGVTEEIARQAKRAFRDYLIGAGILKIETGHS